MKNNKYINNISFEDLYYIEGSKIESLYTQLNDNVTSIVIEKRNNLKLNFTTQLHDMLLKLFNLNFSTETEHSGTETRTYNISLEDKFLKVIKSINEKEYKDVFYLIEKHMKNNNQIFAIGKARFTHKFEGDKLKSLIKHTNFPVKLSKNNSVLITHNSLYSYPSLEKPEIIIPMYCGDLPQNCQKVYMIIDDKLIEDKFCFDYTCNTDHHFIGKIVRYENNYFLIPYAIWGHIEIL